MKHLKVACVFLVLYSCGKSVYHLPPKINEEPKKLLVFIDGTGNNESNRTNIAKLYSLATLRNDGNTNAIYIEGVGTKGRVIGLATGWGIGKDVRDSYRFLVDNYKKERNDEIYIFGFSRGAYASRILAGFIDSAGIFDLSQKSEKEKKAFIRKLYRVYKENDIDIESRRKRIEFRFGSVKRTMNVYVEFMGLWDTVEALGLPNSKENYILPNKRYNDQLCNVKKAAHALALNDRRSHLFTPILLTEKHLISNCEKPLDIDKKVDEVWFFGAHADVGGGYENTFLPSYSLNWMLKKVKNYEIIPKDSGLNENFNSLSHDGRYFLMRLISSNRKRNLKKYSQNSSYNGGKLKIHSSVLERIKNGPLESFEMNLVENFHECFSLNNSKGYDKISNKCFDIVD